MFCPQCGQQQNSNTVRFCSRCGFALDTVSELLTDGGASKALRRGVWQGAMLMLMVFGIVGAPVLAYILTHDWVRFRFIPICMFLSFMAALARILYALIFEGQHSRFKQGSLPPGKVAADAQFGSGERYAAITPAQSVPVGVWREQVSTAEVQPLSVAESTTKLLENEPE
jgi:MFS family permease